MGADFDDDFSDTEPVQILEPPPPPPINLKAQTDAAVSAHQEEAKANGLKGEEPIKKKKKNKKKKNKNTQPSGFEDFYVEAPLSPEQAAELNQLYSLKKPFAERIELCIQRYRAKRRWDPDRLKYFDRYLVLGGIRTGQKAYGGGVSTEARGEDGEELDASDIQAQTATDYVEHYQTSNRNQDNWKGTPGVFDDDDEEWFFAYIRKKICWWQSRQ